MIIGSTDIQTPFVSEGDDPFNVSCDWAHQVSVALVDNGVPPSKIPAVIKKCPAYDDITEHIKYIKEVRKSSVAARKKHSSHFIADGWFTRRNNSCGRDYIDPLLLGGAPYELVAGLGGEASGSPLDPEIIRVYQSLFYNCRKEDGSISSPIRNRILALSGAPRLAGNAPEQEQWKVAAAMYSYPVVVEQWGFWDVPKPDSWNEGLLFNYQRRMGMFKNLTRMHSMSDEDRLTAVHHVMEFEKHQHDIGSGGSEGAFANLLGDFLLLAAPRLIEHTSDADTNKAYEKALKSKLESQKAVQDVEVEDLGPVKGAAKRNKQIKEHLASEAKRQEAKK
jgi:hypothetical protein